MSAFFSMKNSLCNKFTLNTSCSEENKNDVRKKN